MNEFIIALGWCGVFAPVALGAVGSSMGCTIAGQAAIGACLETEGGYGKFIGVAAMPSSQVIYGIVVMFALNREMTAQVAPGIFGIGIFLGIALWISGAYQGRAVASAVSASASKPEIFGLSLAPAAIVEGFSVFAFIFALVVAGGLPSG